jgi:protein phosphatase
MAIEGAERQERDDIDAHSGLMRQSIVLRDAVYRANKIIFQTAQSQTHCEGMGTTIVACMFFDNKISVAHVGDSRAYRLRDGELIQLTMDHSLLQELVDRGFYSAEEAQRSTNRNYVTRALGVEPTVEVEVHEHEVLPEDIYLLCSDGLPDMVEDEDIHLTISTFNASLDVVGQQLVELANDHGGRDNISVMLAQVMESFAAKKNMFVKIAGWFRS